MNKISADTVTAGAVVAGPRPQSAAAGLDVLKRGGNAVDAAVAAVLALCVALPDNVGIAGYGGSMLIYSAIENRVLAIDFDSRAPLDFTPDLYLGKPDAHRYGYLAVSVPGVVSGLALALEKYGTMSWKDVSTFAADLAEEGVEVDVNLAGALKFFAEKADPVSLKAIMPDGVAPQIGDWLVQKDLARLIRRLGEEGPQALYNGDIPKAIVRQIRDNGGILSEADFSGYSARFVEPISVKHNGYDIYVPPVPSGSLTGLQALNTMSCFDLAALEPWSAEYFHLLIESLNAGWEDRRRYLGDPDFVDVPVKMLLSMDYAEQCAERIRRSGVSLKQPAEDSSGHTVHVVAADEKRNMVSLTATQGEMFGSRVAIDGLGLVIGHGMARFDFTEGSPNYPAPLKRMQHNMCPTIIMKDGRPYCAIGLPGGTKIVSVTPQLIMNLLDFGTSVSGALAAPRIHTEGTDSVVAQPKVGDRVISKLEEMGHKITRAEVVGGPASGLVIRESDGAIAAAASKGPECVGVLR